MIILKESALLVKPLVGDVVTGSSSDLVSIPQVCFGEGPRDRFQLIHQVAQSGARVIVTVRSMVELLEAMRQGAEFVEAGFPFDLSAKGIALCMPRKGMRTPTVDLWDPSFALDAHPIEYPLSCLCSTCQRHTRGYIHHLLNVQEMNGEILLSVHNLHVVYSIVHQCREHHEDLASYCAQLIDYILCSTAPQSSN